MNQPDDERLRSLLDDAVSDVDPSPALDRIRARTKVTPMSSKRPWIAVALGAVAATAATIVAVTVMNDDDTGTTAGPAASQTPEPTDASPSPGTSESPSETVEPPETFVVPVYYVAETNTGPRLFREFHRVPAAGSPQSQWEAALAEAVGSPALDPDYSSPWADLGAGAGAVTYEGGTLTVDIIGEGLRTRPGTLSEEYAGMAVEQLVATAQAALGEGDVPVQLLLNGGRTDQLLGVPVAEPLAAGDPMQVQGTVWIIDPQDGDTVDSTFTVEGRGAFFEANVSWQLLQDGAVVKDGFAMAEEGMTLSPYEFTVEDVPAGDYVLRVYDADMSGGAEGNGEAEDTKRITVR